MTGSPSASRAPTHVLALAALGVVYGDIGTSPLYAFKEAFAEGHGLAVSHAHVLATLSTMFWALMLVISFKYVWVVLRFDNEGEGGVLALTALASRVLRRQSRWTSFAGAAGVFAAALFYGDAILTPAISVLSAIEGVSIATPALGHLVIPITMAILVTLFAVQRYGTARVGGLFGPITIVWFLTLGTLGVRSILQTPAVLAAVNPLHAINFALTAPGAAFLLLSAVFLALTGGEALYADMGHFGARPVRVAWYGLVCPALLLNYFGQGALVLRDAAAAANPFYFLAPEWLQLPLVILAAAATVIASQATITGAYSLTLQASRLGYLPRVQVLHTSDSERGQIYIPGVNWVMLLAVLLLVLQFKTSGALAAAYGVAVSGTMLVTTLLTGSIVFVVPGRWRVPLLASMGFFILLETAFLGSNLTKFTHGGWLPIALGAGIFVMLKTWKRGSALVAAQRQNIDIPLADFLAHPPSDVPRVPGTAVYLTSDPSLVPSALFHNLKHYQVLHAQNVFLHVVTAEVPRVDAAQRLEVTVLGPGFYRVAVNYGFREEPDIPAALAGDAAAVLALQPLTTSYFVARSVVVDGPGLLPPWRSALFGWMTRQSEGASSFFRLPPNRVVELGTQVIL